MAVDVSVVIPAFNEERRIERTVRRVCDYFEGVGDTYEVVVSDDGSTDATPEIVARLSEESLPVRLLRGAANRGKGHAVRRGVMESTGARVLVTDADLATPIEEEARLREHILAGDDVAIGSRGLRGSQIVIRQPLFREILGRFFNLLVQVLVLPGIWDTQCGFKLFRGALARSLFAVSVVDGFAFDAEVLGLGARSGAKIAEVPVRWSHMNCSKVRLSRHSLEMFLDLAATAYRLRTGRYAAALSNLPDSASEIPTDAG
jgi:dolichyl-phosphate beta-glucosyltransferase